MSDFDLDWEELLGKCPFDKYSCTAAWAFWMQRAGYQKRLHGDLLNKRIVDEITKDYK